MNDEDSDSVVASEVNRIVGLYGFSNEVQVTPLSRSENIVFLVDDPTLAIKYVARVNSGRLAYHTKSSIESELTWLSAIQRDTDILVPTVLEDLDGEKVHQLAIPGPRSRFVSLYSFLPGEEPGEEDLPSKFNKLGAITAELHEHARSWAEPAGFSRHNWSPEAILDDTLGWGHWKNGVGIEGEVADTLERAEEVLRNRLFGLPKDHQNYGMLHADLRLANILVHGNSIGIIDFDDCGYGWYLYELPSALSFIETHPEVETLISEWINGYQTFGTLTGAMLDELPSLLLLRRYSLIAWLGYQQRHLELARDIGAQYTLDSFELARTYLSHFA